MIQNTRAHDDVIVIAVEDDVIVIAVDDDVIVHSCMTVYPLGLPYERRGERRRETNHIYCCSMIQKWLSEAALYIMYAPFLYSSGGDGGGFSSGTQGEPLST